MKPEITWITVMTFTSRSEAELAKGRLEQAGIAALVQADDAGGMIPQLASTAYVALQVDQSNLDKARAFLL